MGICISPCIADLPQSLAAVCKEEGRPSGINHLIIAQCDVKFVEGENPVTDVQSWKDFVDAGKIMLSPLLAEGEKPEPDNQTQRISACRPEIVINQTHSVTGHSIIADAENLDDFKFWNELGENLSSYLIGWLGCDGLVYGDWNNDKPGFIMSGLPSHVKATTNDEDDMFMFNFEFKKKGIVVPVKVDNFLTAFE
jgi:hypothetical protein